MSPLPNVLHMNTLVFPNPEKKLLLLDNLILVFLNLTAMPIFFWNGLLYVLGDRMQSEKTKPKCDPLTYFKVHRIISLKIRVY